MAIYLEIAVTVPLFDTLSYRLPEKFAEFSGRLVGCRVFVPLGNRRVTGYILAENSKLQDEAIDQGVVIKEIIDLLDDSPIFHKEMVAFFRWIAAYYLYPLGMVIKAALPGGLVVKSAKQLILKASAAELLQQVDSEEAWVLELVEKRRLSPARTAKLLAKRKSAEKIAFLQKKRLLECQLITQRESVGRRLERCFQLSSSAAELLGKYSKEINKAEIDDKGHIQSYIKELRKKLADQDNLFLGFSEVKTLVVLLRITGGKQADIRAKELFRSYPGARKGIKQLIAEKLLVEHQRRIFHDPFVGTFFQNSPRFMRPGKLSSQQKKVLAAIQPAIYAGKYKAFLLYGITGSGKTEVYLHAAEETLASGRDVIVLVPEIALATQLEGQFVARFGDKVVLQHSGLKPAEKYDQYTLALSGEARVVIGARSAVFAPVKNPGLIIVDEEHDSSYKQDDSFRYNGRDLAVVRSSLQNAVVLLGSATPAVTSFAHGQSGKFTLLEMDKRIGDAVLPAIHLVNIGKDERVLRGGLISALLFEKLEKTYAAGYQTILLLNRRGFSSALICVQCGTPVQCPHCSVSLTLHKFHNRLICHYCGFQQGMQTACSQCRSEKLLPAGFGTEKVEEEVAALLPGAVVRRLDSDVAGDRQRFHSLLAEMRERKIDILIGTQMIAKGHHFPYVTLVGVVRADGGMSMPDYKAAEKGFQLITQVTGRAGRGELPGEVVIQTFRPEHYAIEYARKHQYPEFFAHEMQLRHRPVFPPFVRLVLLRLQGRVERVVHDGGIALARFCRSWKNEREAVMEILGPAPSPIDKIKDNFRYQILVKCVHSKLLHQLGKEILCRQQQLLPGGVRVSIDIDPENMM